MNVCDLVQEKRAEILAIAAYHGASNVRVLSSAVRNRTSTENDVDFLVELEPNRSLIDHIGLMQDLEDLLGRKVHVVTERGLKEPFRDSILEAAMPL